MMFADIPREERRQKVKTALSSVGLSRSNRITGQASFPAENVNERQSQGQS